MVSRMILLLAVFCFMLFGCICPSTGGEENTTSSGNDTIVIYDSGTGSGNTNNNGGMSDPSKCNNLPPQQMADCLEDAMGG